MKPEDDKRRVESLAFPERIERVLRDHMTEGEQKKALKMLSLKTGISAGTIQAKFNGHQNWNIVDAYNVSKAFRISLDWLAYGDGEMLRGERSRKASIIEEPNKTEHELLEEFKKKAETQGFAVAGCWLQHKLTK